MTGVSRRREETLIPIARIHDIYLSTEVLQEISDVTGSVLQNSNSLNFQWTLLGLTSVALKPFDDTLLDERYILIPRFAKPFTVKKEKKPAGSSCDPRCQLSTSSPPPQALNSLTHYKDNNWAKNKGI